MESIFELGQKEHMLLKISSLGAEIRSWKLNNHEMIWPAQRPWLRSSPWLFPIVGRLLNGEYEIEGRRYSMVQHGFLRDQNFLLEEKTDSKLKFKYVSCGHEGFPFRFTVRIEYFFENPLCLRIEFRVCNDESIRCLPFSLGWHPGYLSSKAQGFSLKGTSYRIGALDQNGHCDLEKERNLPTFNRLNCSDFPDLRAAQVLTGGDLSQVDWSGESGLKMKFEPSPEALALWSADSDQFVCLESWWGKPLCHRPFLYELKPQEEKKFSIHAYQEIRPLQGLCLNKA